MIKDFALRIYLSIYLSIHHGTKVIHLWWPLLRSEQVLKISTYQALQMLLQKIYLEGGCYQRCRFVIQQGRNCVQHF